MKAGPVLREHYAYEKKGSCALLGAIEPKTGKRVFAVFEHRTKREFALHLKQIAEEFPEADKIRLVLDSLNTHRAIAFYETFPAHEAFKLAEKFEFFYTPVRASWLNMIEIEFSASSAAILHLARQIFRKCVKGL